MLTGALSMQKYPQYISNMYCDIQIQILFYLSDIFILNNFTIPIQTLKEKDVIKSQA